MQPKGEAVAPRAQCKQVAVGSSGAHPCFYHRSPGKGEKLPRGSSWDPHVAPTLLTSALAHKGNPHPKLLLSQGLKDAPLQRVLHWPRLVLLGAALALLRAEPVKPQGSTKPGWGQLLLQMGNWQRRLLRAGLPKETWLKQPS